MNYKLALLTPVIMRYPTIFRNRDLVLYLCQFLDLWSLSQFLKVGKIFYRWLKVYFGTRKLTYLKSINVSACMMYQLTGNPIYRIGKFQKLNSSLIHEVVNSGDIQLFKFIKHKYPNFIEIVFDSDIWKLMRAPMLELIIPDIPNTQPDPRICTECHGIHHVTPKDLTLGIISVEAVEKYQKYYTKDAILRMSIIFSRTDLFNYIINTGFRPINIIRNLSLEHGFVTGLQYLHMNNLLPKKIWGSQYGETGKFLLSHNYLYTGGIYLRS